jgi:hypothetical protein
MRALKDGMMSRKKTEVTAQILRGLGAERFMFDPTGRPLAGAKEVMRITKPKTRLFYIKAQ